MTRIDAFMRAVFGLLMFFTPLLILVFLLSTGSRSIEVFCVVRMRSYRIRGRRARRAARPIMDSSPGASRLPENGLTLVDLPPPIALFASALAFA